MKQAPEHFSHSYELNLSKLPAQKADRIALRILYPGLFLGLALIVLGVYELLDGFQKLSSEIEENLPWDGEPYEPLFDPSLFDTVIIFVGLGIVVSLILSYIQYKKVKFDGKDVTVTHRSIWGDKKTYTENLQNYEGVRLRIEFFQFGFINTNKYIVELYHKNSFKTIPLYISTHNKNIRKIWEDYASTLKIPAITMTDEGMIKRDIKNLDVPVKTLIKKGLLANTYDDSEPIPASIAYVRKGGKTIIKSRKILWDAYNVILWFCLIALGLALIVATVNYTNLPTPHPWLLSMYIAGMALIAGIVYSLFRKDKVVVKKEKIIIVHKFMLFSRKKDELKKNVIESIDVTFNPATERYFLSIASDEKTLIFGKMLPVEDLRWVRRFLINEIAK